MPNATFDAPDLTTFARVDELGLVVVGQHLPPARAVLECRLADEDPWCRACGARSTSRGTVSRSLAHAPFGHRPTTLLVRIRRYRCDHCGNRWREDTSTIAPERAKLTRGGIRWALEALVVDHLSIARVAAGLGVAWHTANDAVLAEGQRLLIDDPARFDGVAVIGVDEHVWRRARWMVGHPGRRNSADQGDDGDPERGGSTSAVAVREHHAASPRRSVLSLAGPCRRRDPAGRRCRLGEAALRSCPRRT